MPWHQGVVGLGGHRRQLYDRLGDPAPRVGLDFPANRRHLLLGGLGPEDDPVAAGALDRFDDQFLGAVEHLLALVVEPAPQRVDIGQQRLLAQVVLDDGRHVGVDQLVVADAVAHRAGDDHVAGPGGVEHPGHPEHRVGPELHGIEEIVVDAAVDDVDPALPLGGAHVDDVVPAEQVGALDQFDAHLPGQQRVLEVGGVERSRGQHDHGGVRDVGRRRVAQGAQQVRRVVVDRTHPVGAEQVGKHPGHHPAVLHDVGDPRRRAQVVLEDPEGALGVADDVDAGDVDADPVGRGDPGRFAVEVLAGTDQSPRDDPVAQDLLVAVDVVEEPLEGDHALGDPALQLGPLGRRDHPGDQVQRERALLLAGQRECDALVDEGPAQRLGAGSEFVGPGRGEFGVDALVGGSDVALPVEHLVVRAVVGTEFAVAAEDVGVVRGSRSRGGRSCLDPSTGWGHGEHAASETAFSQAERLDFGGRAPKLVLSICAARAEVPAREKLALRLRN